MDTKYPPALLAKMKRIMQTIDRIAKDRKNTNANYMYASEKAIKEAMHSAFAKEGILFKLDVIDVAFMEMGPKGITTIKTEYAFIDCETGESIEGSFIGTGNGRDEKGAYAAVTGSLKYILTSTFMIPTGDDPEDDRYDYVPEEKAGVVEAVKKPEPVVEKPAAVKVVPKKEPVARTVEPTNNDNVKLTVRQKEIVIDAFEKAGIEIWDLEKVAGDAASWTFADKRQLLKKYNALVAKDKEYNQADFLAGKLPSC